MSAPEMSAAEAEVVARFDAAEPAPESVVERVARAIAEEDYSTFGVLDWPDLDEDERNLYLRFAHVALAVLAVGT